MNIEAKAVELLRRHHQLQNTPMPRELFDETRSFIQEVDRISHYLPDPKPAPKWFNSTLTTLLIMGCVFSGFVSVLTLANAPEAYLVILASISIASWVIMAITIVGGVILDTGPSNVG